VPNKEAGLKSFSVRCVSAPLQIETARRAEFEFTGETTSRTTAVWDTFVFFILFDNLKMREKRERKEREGGRRRKTEKRGRT
jgi:hypothetical protein